MGWSVLGDLADVRLAIAWTTDTSPADSFYTTTVVHNAETISQSRYDSIDALSLTLIACTDYNCPLTRYHFFVFDYQSQRTSMANSRLQRQHCNVLKLGRHQHSGIGNCLLQSSTADIGAGSGADRVFDVGRVDAGGFHQQYAVEILCALSIFLSSTCSFFSFPDGGSYPYENFYLVKTYKWVPKLRITRNNNALFSASACTSATALVAQPIPTVFRVTGPQSSHPAYGFYVSAYSETPADGTLVYRFVSSPFCQRQFHH